MEDNKIIDLFFERSEKAIIELSNKYEPVCMKVSMNVLNNKQDAEECVNDSYLAVWNAIPPEKPNPLIAFLCKIVRNISINRYKYNSMKKRNSNYDLCLEELEDCVSDSACTEDNVSASELSGYINDFLESLNETNQMLFVRRYWFMDSYADLSTLTGFKEGAIRTRIARIKNDLMKYLIERGVNFE